MARQGGSLPVCLAMFVLTLTGAEKPPEFYVRNMLDTNAAAQSLTRTIPAKDYGRIAEDAIVLRRLFATTLTFWEQRKTTDAIEFAKAGAGAADTLALAAAAKDDDAIVSAAKAVNDTCKSCHELHRERLPDKSFQIK